MDGDERERVRRYVAQLDRARATLAEELDAELAAVRHLTLAERGCWVASACEAAAAIFRARRHVSPGGDLDEPPAPDFEEKWQALMARYRAAQRSSG